MRQIQTSDGIFWTGGKVLERSNPLIPMPDPDPAPKRELRGIHGSAGMGPPPRELWEFWISELKAMGISWYKQLDSGDPNDLGPNSTFSWCKALRAAGIEPIVRFYISQQYPKHMPGIFYQKMRAFSAAGITYAEIGNEPNLPVEWEQGYHDSLSWRDPFYPEVIARNWIHDAEWTAQAGMRPAFYALAPTDWGSGRPHPSLSSVEFYGQIFGMIDLDRDLRDRFVSLFKDQGAWLAVHVSTYEMPPAYSPWQDPPYDMCLRGYEIPLKLLDQIFGLDQVKVMSTEGGVFCMDSGSMAGHTRLKSHEEHGLKTLQMFDWLERNSPLDAMCPWLLCGTSELGHNDPSWWGDSWYRESSATGKLEGLPVVDIMKGGQ